MSRIPVLRLWSEGRIREALADLGPARAMPLEPGQIASISTSGSAEFPAIAQWGIWPVVAGTRYAIPPEQPGVGKAALPRATLPSTIAPRSLPPRRFAPRRQEAQTAVQAHPRTRRAPIFGRAALLLLLLVAGPALGIIWTLPPVDLNAPAQREGLSDSEPGVDPPPPQVVSREEIPDHLVNAVVAIEDRRFYSHLGLDPAAIARAAARNYQAGRIREGGSTITQQLAKVLYLTPEQTFRRKLKEAVIATWLDFRLSKDEILTAYLNNIYFGAGATGIADAAKIYFNKPVRDLNVAESVMLAGLIHAPTRLNPQSNLEQARRRATVVLFAMVEEGYLSREAAVTAALDAAAPIQGTALAEMAEDPAKPVVAGSQQTAALPPQATADEAPVTAPAVRQEARLSVAPRAVEPAVVVAKPEPSVTEPVADEAAADLPPDELIEESAPPDSDGVGVDAAPVGPASPPVPEPRGAEPAPAVVQARPKPRPAAPAKAQVAERKAPAPRAQPQRPAAERPAKPRRPERQIVARPAPAPVAKSTARTRLAERRAFAEAYAAKRRAAAERRASQERARSNRRQLPDGPTILLGGQAEIEVRPVEQRPSILLGGRGLTPSRIADSGPSILLGGRGTP